MPNDIVLISGNSNVSLATEICESLWQPLGLAQVRRFSDGEILVEIGENVRGRDTFVIQSTCFPVNDNLMELLLIIDALKRASARRITAVIPYYGYARQDRKAAPRVPISAKLVADLLTAAGTTRVLAMDLHAGQIQGFFNIPVDHLFAAPVLLNHIKEAYVNGDNTDIILVSPDAGGVERTRYLAKRLSAPLAIVDKRREAPNVAKAMNIIGDVKGRRALIIDDMVDTAGTLTQAADFVKSKGAVDVVACATHPVFSGQAVDLINHSSLTQVVVTNTIPLNPGGRDLSKIKVLSVASLLAEAIRRIHQEDSISSLFV
ncbi:MAG: ribose-phosphate pyrophosphokinase [Deltaproteobacteria bacterium]|jgi:ribose-phosphate pyrophosphokinase|nr:ribose-phosphate pyrophosphokinase [Deltaproteobacteria bacterium]